MKTVRTAMRKLAWTFLFIAIAAISLGTTVCQVRAQEDESRFREEELVQMLAPIALYPDSLIAQMLMAATYPLEVVEAERWLRDNPELQGDALSDALREKPWDPSVKSLCYFPDVLFAMSDKLDQTRKLGDAFLIQEQEVMDTIQELRRRAREQGNLETTEEQQVIVEQEVVRIEPASPEIVYVPVYDPYYVYGPWWYPAYPPYYWYYPPWFFGSSISISFGPRIFISGGFFSWVWFDWYVHRIYIDVFRTYRFHRYPVRPSYERNYWRHDPRHRRGIAYRDRKTSEHFGVPTQRLQSPRPETRGYPRGTVEKMAPPPLTTSPTPSRERTLAPQPLREPQKTQTAPLRKMQPSAPAQGRERAIAPEPRLEPQSVQPLPPRVTPRSAPAESSETEKTPPAPLRKMQPSAPASGRERTIAPEPRLEPQSVQPSPSRITPRSVPAERSETERIPSAPAPGRERTIAPEPRSEPRTVQPPPPRIIPRPAPAERIETEKTPSASVPRRERSIAPEPRPEPQSVQPPPPRVIPQPAPAEKSEPEKIPPSSVRDTPFRGITEGSSERRAGERGEESRRSGEAQRQNESEKRPEDPLRKRGDGPRR